MIRQQSPLNWTVGFSSSVGQAPAERLAASVPGAVQLDYARAHQWPDYWIGDNFKQYAWMEDVYWHYQTTLDLSATDQEQSVHLVCRGIDYKFEIRLNGKTLFAQEGMFTPVDLDLTGKAKTGDTLEIILWPAPKVPGRPDDRTQAAHSCKPPVSYGWDWHPRLIPLGIWDDCYLELRPTRHIIDAEVRYELSEDLTHAHLSLQATISQAKQGFIHWTLLDPAGTIALSAEAKIENTTNHLTAELPDPLLWWPHDQGPQHRYLAEVKLLDDRRQVIDSRQMHIGFRRVKLVMAPNQWAHPGPFPKSRSYPPITVEINNRPIFSKGSNWVNPEIFPGIITRDTYQPLLQMARDAHMNLLRVWGGGIVNKQSFFDLCDELGLMVWQEFPLACNNYPDEPAYLKTLDQEARSIITRLRRHPSLAIWCGGNELFNSWSGMTDQSHALRLIGARCYELDKNTPFLPTSPVDGMAHGCYMFRYNDNQEVFQMMPRSDFTAYTEFGVPGPSPVDYLKTFIPENDLFPPKAGTAWETHHAFGAWLGSTWFEIPLIEEYFGKSDDLDTLVARGQWLQSEGYKCIFEESRRQKPACSMALNWCYNEPWPSAANNSLINWPAKPKRAYHAVAASCRPTLASARIAHFRWREGELFAPELWLLHDAPRPLPAGTLRATLLAGDESILLLNWDFPELPANTNLAGPTVRLLLPSFDSDRITLKLEVLGKPELTSEYVLRYIPRQKPKQIQQTATMNA